MPLWTAPTTPAADRARAEHTTTTGAAPAHVASAPATWSLIGEHIDHFGGVTIMGLNDMRAAVAVGPRTDGTVRVHCQHADGTTSEESITMDQVSALAAEQQPTVDEEGQPIEPPAPQGGLAARLGGIIHTMINRQLLTRDTAGADITVVTDIPATAGLGAAAAIDVATALALLGDADDPHDAPLRARLAEVCAQAVGTFAHYPALRARHSAALRGTGDAITIIDYADGSVTQAPHVVNQEVAAFVLAVPGEFDSAEAVADIRARERFVDKACVAFGAESLRLLPDAPQRVLEWLAAVHKVHGPENQPTIAQATAWLNFYAEETERAQAVARALRSRRGAELFPLLTQSQSALATVYGFDSAEKLAELATARGALAARSAHAGTSTAVIAYVPHTKAHNFAADLAADGLLVVPIAAGTPAVTEG